MLPSEPTGEQKDAFAGLLLQAARDCWPAVRAHVLNNSGSPEDAEDLLQEAVLVALSKLRSGNLAPDDALAPYLLGIARNKWLHRLREKRQQKEVTNQHPLEYNAEEPSEEQWRQAGRYRLYLEKLEQLDESCRTLLTMDFQGTPLPEIARALNYTYAYVRKKKNECLARLTRLIREDQRFSDLL